MHLGWLQIRSQAQTASCLHTVSNLALNPARRRMCIRVRYLGGAIACNKHRLRRQAARLCAHRGPSRMPMALRSSAVVVERSCCSVAPAARSLSTVSCARAASIPASCRKGSSPASHSSPPTRACNGPASVCVRRAAKRLVRDHSSIARVHLVACRETGSPALRQWHAD